MSNNGDYSWFVTVVPAASENKTDYSTTPPTVNPLPIAQRRLFNVSIVICYKRNFSPASIGTFDGEHTANIAAGVTGFPGMGIGGGTVVLNQRVNAKYNQWVMLYIIHKDSSGNVIPQLNRCNWYRVVGTAMDVSSGPMITLNGPDLVQDVQDPNLQAVMVVIPGVIGVYNTTMELDYDSLWMK
jgi:hypothetical protein